MICLLYIIIVYYYRKFKSNCGCIRELLGNLLLRALECCWVGTLVTDGVLVSAHGGISRADRVYEARKPKNNMYNLNLVSK